VATQEGDPILTCHPPLQNPLRCSFLHGPQALCDEAEALAATTGRIEVECVAEPAAALMESTVKPSASVRQFIESAVNMPEQVGHALHHRGVGVRYRRSAAHTIAVIRSTDRSSRLPGPVSAGDGSQASYATISCSNETSAARMTRSRPTVATASFLPPCQKLTAQSCVAGSPSTSSRSRCSA
jgi:hypothetical protein